MTTETSPSAPVPVHPMPVDADLVGELRRRVSGRVAYPADVAYADLVAGHDLAADHRPAVVVEPLDAADVEAAVSIAAAHGLAVSVQATGHGTGHPVRGGLLVVTRRLDGVEVDVMGRTVTVGAGVTWGRLAEAADAHGLTAVTTSGPTVGVIGSTLGGGVGPLARQHGFAADHVAAMDVVTADGLSHRVLPGSDLHWALCGGRDGIGVVTSMTLRLLPALSLWGGELVWSGADLESALEWWQALAASAPDGITTSAMAATAPDVDEVPAAMRGQAVLRVTVCATVADARAVEDSLTAAPTPLVRALGPLTAAEFLARHGDVAPAMPTWQRGFALAECTPETLDVITSLAGPASGSPVLGVEVRRLGGALHASSDRETDALSGRDAEWLVNVLGAPDPALFAEVLPALARRLEAALEPWSTGGSLLNFHGRPGPGHELDLAWPTPVRSRLERIRSAIDPAGAFRSHRADLPS